MKEYLFSDLTRNMDSAQAESFVDYLVGSHEDKHDFIVSRFKKPRKHYKVSALDKCDIEECRSILAKYL